MKRRLAIGIDVGGTKLLGVVWDGRRVVRRMLVPSHAEEGRAAIHGALDEALGALGTAGCRSIGVGMPGQVDRSGIFRSGPHVGSSARGWDVRKGLRARYRIPVAVLNDAQAFTLAEARAGAGRGKRLVVGIAIGTGIGGGIVEDGEVVRGADGTAGEFGHLTVHADNPVRCPCGAAAHLEAFVSGTAARRAWNALSGEPLAKTDVFALEKRARTDRRAAHLWRHMQETLAIGFADVLTALNPDIIVIGGGLAKARSLWRPAARLARAHVPYRALARTPFIGASFGDAAGAVGAAMYASSQETGDKKR